jgi:hypothetical protein
MTKARKHYKFSNEFKGKLTARFEIDGKVFVTDRSTLDLLNYKREHDSLRVAGWLFAANLATGRIKPTNRVAAPKAD